MKAEMISTVKNIYGNIKISEINMVNVGKEAGSNAFVALGQIMSQFNVAKQN